jgi:hypothetical protein
MAGRKPRQPSRAQDAPPVRPTPTDEAVPPTSTAHGALVRNGHSLVAATMSQPGTSRTHVRQDTTHIHPHDDNDVVRDTRFPPLGTRHPPCRTGARALAMLRCADPDRDLSGGTRTFVVGDSTEPRGGRHTAVQGATRSWVLSVRRVRQQRCSGNPRQLCCRTRQR